MQQEVNTNFSVKTLVTPYMKMRLEDGILLCEFVKDLDMDLNIAKQCLIDRIDFSQSQHLPVLINLKRLRSVTKEAREFLSSDGTAFISVGAFIVTSPLTRLIANIFLAVNKPPVPTKIFTVEKNALEWIRRQIEDSPN